MRRDGCFREPWGSFDQQSYLSNSADIQRTCPVAGTGSWGHGVEVGITEACKIQWFL